MTITAITVEHLSKVYHLYDSPTARMKEALHPFRKKYHHDFYALNDVSFSVEQGEVLGIIGKNGCGKSTLLKILAGVLTPTSGTVSVNGNVSALLELGGGFNPEFSGLENVYFSSAIMGYSREQVEKNLDNILAFADIGEFIHQPVKMYSSGMYVRLAFAVAINVEPDILIVDEALAVGDEAFQRKCYGKIRAIQERGTTILFVTHSGGTVVELCQEAMLFDQGELILQGVPKFVVSKYHQFLYAEGSRKEEARNEIKRSRLLQRGADHISSTSTPEQSASIEQKHSSPITLSEFYDHSLKPETPITYSANNDYGVKIENVRITTIDKKQANHLLCGRQYIYTYNVAFHKKAFQVRFGMLIKTTTGFEIGGSASSTIQDAISCVEEQTTIIVQFRFVCLLHAGTYFMNAGVVGIVEENEVYLDRVIDGCMFKVLPEEGLFETGIVSFVVEPSYFII